MKIESAVEPLAVKDFDPLEEGGASLGASLELAADVARAVAGDKNFGPDSTLYEAMGHVRSSQRKSGLTCKKKTGGNEEKKA